MNRKEKRKESKKRKLEAYLNAAESNENSDLISKQPKIDINDNEICSVNTDGHEAGCVMKNSDDEIAMLRAQKRERQKAKMALPVFFITGIGHDAELSIEELDSSFKQKFALHIQDIQHLMLFSILGRKSPHKTRWCRLMRYDKMSHATVVVIEGLSIHTLRQYKKNFSQICSLFSSGLKVSPLYSYGTLMSELCKVTLSVSLREKLVQELGSLDNAIEKGDICESYKILFPINENDTQTKGNTSNITDKFDRTKLLLDVKNMVLENYPVEHKAGGMKLVNYKYTKEKYKKVSPKSPLFALDCEMCVTSAHQSELTRISIVNEELQVIYETLVKPASPITDYLTKYSGITKSILNGVTTSLEDVQNKIQQILPEDAILCGHSLNFDLHALKMIHPYVIDTSVIFNLSGIARHKPSLKLISEVFIKETIQSSSSGHDPTEDSLSTMKLVKLKLHESFEFGNALLNDQVPNVFTKQKPDSTESKYLHNRTGFVQSFFKHAQKEAKKVLLIGTTDLIDQIPGIESLNDMSVTTAKDNKEVILKARELGRGNDLTICHLNMKKCESKEISGGMIERLDKRIGKLYNSCAPRSLFIVLFSGLVTEDMKIENGFCMTKIRD